MKKRKKETKKEKKKKGPRKHCNRKIRAFSGDRNKTHCTYHIGTVYIPTVSIS